MDKGMVFIAAIIGVVALFAVFSSENGSHTEDEPNSSALIGGLEIRPGLTILKSVSGDMLGDDNVSDYSYHVISVQDGQVTYYMVKTITYTEHYEGYCGEIWRNFSDVWEELPDDVLYPAVPDSSVYENGYYQVANGTYSRGLSADGSVGEDSITYFFNTFGIYYTLNSYGEKDVFAISGGVSYTYPNGTTVDYSEFRHVLNYVHGTYTRTSYSESTCTVSEEEFKALFTSSSVESQINGCTTHSQQRDAKIGTTTLLADAVYFYGKVADTGSDREIVYTDKTWSVNDYVSYSDNSYYVTYRGYLVEVKEYFSMFYPSKTDEPPECHFDVVRTTTFTYLYGAITK